MNMSKYQSLKDELVGKFFSSQSEMHDWQCFLLFSIAEQLERIANELQRENDRIEDEHKEFEKVAEVMRED